MCRRSRCGIDNRPVTAYPPPMHRYGVKLSSGRILWVAADAVECRDGAILFYRGAGSDRRLIAGFSLAQVSHFGVPDAFVSGDT